MKKSTLVWILVLLVLSTLTYYVIATNNEKRIKLKAESVKNQEYLNERFLKGPYIANESKLSEFETAKTVIYPSGESYGRFSELDDITCVIYINTKLNHSKFKCSGIMFDSQTENTGDMFEIDN